MQEPQLRRLYEIVVRNEYREAVEHKVTTNCLKAMEEAHQCGEAVNSLKGTMDIFSGWQVNLYSSVVSCNEINELQPI